MGTELCTSHNPRSDKFGISEVSKRVTSEICPLCRREAWLEQDHNHRTDLCRGRICHTCNLLVGRFDRPSDEIQRFIDYLAYWDTQHAAVGGKTYTAYMREMNPNYRRGRHAPRKRALHSASTSEVA